MTFSRRNLLGFAAAAASLPLGSARAAARTKRAAVRTPPIVEMNPEPASPPMKEGHVTSGTARLWWWDTGGSGPAIVLLHPATGSGQVWRYQQQAFVDAGLRVIGYSRRGAAGSTRGDPGDPTSHIDDLKAIIAAAGLKRFHLLGTAAGAITALRYAKESPEGLISLILANSLLGVSGGEVDIMMRSLQSPAIQKLPPELRELGPAYRVANPAGTARWLEYTHGGADATALQGGGAGPGESGPAPGRMATLTLESLRAMRMPVLMIAGDADLLSPPPLMAAAARYLPDCQMTRLPACGHSGYWETPSLFNEAVITFIRKKGRRG